MESLFHMFTLTIVARSFLNVKTTWPPVVLLTFSLQIAMPYNASVEVILVGGTGKLLSII